MKKVEKGGKGETFLFLYFLVKLRRSLSFSSHLQGEFWGIMGKGVGLSTSFGALFFFFFFFFLHVLCQYATLWVMTDLLGLSCVCMICKCESVNGV